MSLENYLSREALAGQVEGKAEFTLNPEAAWRKLGSLQLPNPDAWILKVVQAAVISQAGSVRVTQTRKTTLILVGGVPSWSLHDLLESLFEMKADKGEAIEQLAVAVRALVSRPEHTVSFSFPDGEKVRWNGRLLEDEERQPPTGDFALEIGHKREGSFGDWLQQNAEARAFMLGLSQQLEKYCYRCPVPVLLDGRRIESPARTLLDSSLGLGEKNDPAFVREDILANWKEKNPENKWGEEQPFFEVVLSDKPASSGGANHPGRAEAPPTTGRLWLNYRLTKSPSRFSPRWEEFEDRSSRICLLRHGVIVEKRELELHGALGLEIILSADHLKTDLSGLKIVEDKEKAETLARGISAAIALLEEYRLTFLRRAPIQRLFHQSSWKFSSPLVAGIILFPLAIIVLIMCYVAFLLAYLTVPMGIIAIIGFVWTSYRNNKMNEALKSQEALVTSSSPAIFVRALRKELQIHTVTPGSRGAEHES